MTNIEIRKVMAVEIAQLQDISRKTFYEAYSADNTAENMKSYLENEFSIERLTAELNDENAEFYFAAIQNTIIGYLKLNSGNSQTEVLGDDSIEIERIYVLKEYYGKHVGQQLYDKAIQIAIQKNAVYIWLGVWEKNPRAISFYRKNGFIEFDKHVFKFGTENQTDIMMKFNLVDK